jgi:hypothetical protein
MAVRRSRCSCALTSGVMSLLFQIFSLKLLAAALLTSRLERSALVRLKHFRGICAVYLIAVSSITSNSYLVALTLGFIIFFVF